MFHADEPLCIVKFHTSPFLPLPFQSSLHLIQQSPGLSCLLSPTCHNPTGTQTALYYARVIGKRHVFKSSTYSDFISSLNVEHQILYKSHLIQVRYDMQTWNRDQMVYQRVLRGEKTSQKQHEPRSQEDSIKTCLKISNEPVSL